MLEEKTSEPMCEDGPRDMMCAHRMPACEVLRLKARELRDKAHALEKFADELDRRRLSRESDEILWSLVVNGKI